MKYGRTSMVNFLSQLVMSFSGFVATIVLTRTLGQTQYGTYVVVLSVLSWVAMAGEFGLPQAVKKRVSDSETGNYVVSGAIVQFCLYGIVVVCLWLSRPFLNDFMGISATWALTIMLAGRLAVTFVRTVLDGQHLVHVSSILSPAEFTGRSIVQISLVFLGFGITGAFTGYVIGAVFASVIGAYFVTIPRSFPSRKEFSRLKEYAQFSWLGSLKGQTFVSMDTIILATFVTHSLIAVYEVAWSLASVFAIFGTSISRTLFPEMSKIASAGEDTEEIAELLRISLTYSGLFITPGLVGAALVGDVVLTIYGPGFDTGYYILLILTFARLLYGYMGQFLSTINALDHPSLTFYVNAAFVTANLILNVILTWQFGWYGAAVATTISATIGLILSYYYANTVVDVTVPAKEIGKQWVAAGIMAVVVLIARIIVGDSLPAVIGVAIFGAAIYFVSLLVISQEFRKTVNNNVSNISF